MNLRSRFSEIAIAVVFVVVLLGAVLALARTWPPAVIVESGSMMHEDSDVPYGRYGTLDPGDIVLVRRVGAAEDVALAEENGRGRYGAPGDVIVYRRNGDPEVTPIIHRAVTFVHVDGEGPERTYRIWWRGEWRHFGAEGIHLPELGFTSGQPCCPSGRYQPLWSGFITQGDNPATNSVTDQASLISPQPVKFEWVKGEAVGEVPWLGLVKLALSPRVNTYADGWMRVGNAYAPADLWAMLGASALVMLVAPFAWDVVARRVALRWSR